MYIWCIKLELYYFYVMLSECRPPCLLHLISWNYHRIEALSLLSASFVLSLTSSFVPNGAQPVLLHFCLFTTMSASSSIGYLPCRLLESKILIDNLHLIWRSVANWKQVWILIWNDLANPNHVSIVAIEQLDLSLAFLPWLELSSVLRHWCGCNRCRRRLDDVDDLNSRNAVASQSS